MIYPERAERSRVALVARFFNQASADSTCSSSGTVEDVAGTAFAARLCLVRAVFMGTRFYSGRHRAWLERARRRMARSLHEHSRRLT